MRDLRFAKARRQELLCTLLISAVYKGLLRVHVHSVFVITAPGE